MTAAPKLLYCGAMAHLLIIDDDPAVHAVVSAALKAQGHSFVSAMSGPEGLAQAKARRPDAVVLDFEMPGMSGEGVFEKLRADGMADGVPVLFLSSLPLNRQVSRVDISRNVRFLRKPVTVVEFLKVLRELLPA